MINIETSVINIEYWETGIKSLFSFDDTISTSESVLEEDAYNGYTSPVDKLICQYTTDQLCSYTAVRCVMDDVKHIYEKRGFTCGYHLQGVTPGEFVAVFTYNS